MKLSYLAIIGTILVGITAFGILGYDDSITVDLSTKQSSLITEIMETDGIRHIVPLDQIKSGGPPKDGIPSIDEPKFVSINQANFLTDDDLVVGLGLNGENRAYPLSILVWHEIINDSFGEKSVAVTYCPLCFTMQVFDRTINGQVTEFGTSGKLYNSNLVMYDRLTDSYWSQSLGIAITGELTGTTLKTIPFDVIRWGDWKTIHPDTVVLSTDTGHQRAYGVDPYGSYYESKEIIFPVTNSDDRLHEKEVILGFSSGKFYKAYRQSDVEDMIIINDQIDKTKLVLFSLYEKNTRAYDRTISGQVLEFEYDGADITDTQTGSVWNYDGLAISGKMKGIQLERLGFDPSFWFEWIAIHPDTEVYGL